MKTTRREHLVVPSKTANGAKNPNRFRFKKKPVINQNFLKQNPKNSTGRERVTDRLGGPKIETKRNFGGISFFAENRIFGGFLEISLIILEVFWKFWKNIHQVKIG